MSATLAGLRRHPALATALGAAVLANSAVFVELADVRPATAAFFRLVYAIPLLLALAHFERRSQGPTLRPHRWAATAAGTLFGLDLVLWHHAIEYVGVGLSTVLGNLQVVFLAVISWLVLHERPQQRFLVALPVVLSGVVLISGLLEHRAYGDKPLLGTVLCGLASVCYSGFLPLFRYATDQGRRLSGPLCRATCSAALVTVPISLVAGGIELTPSWPAHGWLALLALTCQVLGWLTLATSLPRLPATLGSLLLLLQPLAAVVLGAVLFGESPTVLQASGCVLVLTGAIYAARRPTDVAPAAPLTETEHQLAAASSASSSAG